MNDLFKNRIIFPIARNSPASCWNRLKKFFANRLTKRHGPAMDLARQVNQLAISNRSHLSKLLAVMAIAAALLFVAILLLNRQSTAWAQVVEAVAKKPWLHSVCTLPDGRKAELWFSADRAVIVTQTDKMVDWSDLKQKSGESSTTQVIILYSVYPTMRGKKVSFLSKTFSSHSFPPRLGEVSMPDASS